MNTCRARLESVEFEDAATRLLDLVDYSSILALQTLSIEELCI